MSSTNAPQFLKLEDVSKIIQQGKLSKELKKYTAKVSLEFAFECPDGVDLKEEVAELLEYVGTSMSACDWKRDTLKIKIYDFEKHKPSDWEEDYELYCQYIKEL